MTLKRRVMKNLPNITMFIVGIAMCSVILEFLLIPHLTRGLYSLYYCAQNDCDKLRVIANTLIFSGLVSLVLLILLRYRYVRVSCNILSIVGVISIIYPISHALSSAMTIVHDERWNTSIILTFMNIIVLMVQTCVYDTRKTILTSDII